jgi:HEAT repeat protein
MTGLVLALASLLLLQDPREAIQRLASDHIEDRDAAARELKRLGDKAIPALREAAGGGDLEIAARCRKILASLELSGTLSPRLLEAFPGIEDRLALAPDELWTEALLEAAREDTDGHRVHPRLCRPPDLDPLAARALRGVNDPATWQKATRIVEQRRLKSAIPVLIENLESDQEPVWRRSIALLGKLDAREAVPGLVHSLSRPDSVDAEQVTQVLKELDRAAAIRELRKHFDEADERTRLNFLMASSVLGDVEAIPLLIRLSQKSEFPHWGLAMLGIEHFDPRDSLDAFTPYLAHPDARVRMHIAEALHRNEAKRGIPALLFLLRDPDETVRIVATRILGAWGAKEAVPGLIVLLEGKERVRDEAAAALGRIGDPAAVPELAALLKTLRPVESGSVVQALADLGSKEAVPGLIGWLSSPSENVRMNSVEILGKLGAADAIPAVADSTKDKVDRVRWQALWALGRLGARDRFDLLTAAFDEPDPTASTFAARGLLALKDPRVPAALIQVLESGKKPARKAVIEALKELRCREALPSLVADLAAPGDDFSGTLEAIREIGLAEALPFLAKAGPQAILRMGYAGSLVPGMVPLLRTLLTNPEAEIRAEALWILETCGDRSALLDLEPLMRDADEQVRRSAAFALAPVGHPEAVKVVRAARGHKEAGVRMRAIRSLVQQDPDDIVPVLVAALEDPSDWVQTAAARGLAHLQRPEAKRALASLAESPRDRLRLRAAESLDRMEEAQRLPLARRLLEDSSPEVRVMAAVWLCRDGKEEGVAELLASQSPRSKVVLNALRAPELWARLDQPWTHGALRATPEELLRLICSDAGLSLTLPPELDLWLGRYSRVTVGERLSPLEFGIKPDSLRLRDILEEAVCNSFCGWVMDVILDKAGVQVVLRETSDRFWERWRAERERR